MAFLLENSGLRIEVCNPNETADSHLHTRFSHCGYITQIIQKKSNEQVLGQPTEVFHPFHGSGFPDEFEIPLGYEEATCGECFLKHVDIKKIFHLYILSNFLRSWGIRKENSRIVLIMFSQERQEKGWF